MRLVCLGCGTSNRVSAERLGERPVCGRCGQSLLEAKPFAIGDQALPNYLENTELPVVIDFWAAWCGPCRAMAPQFEAAAAKAPEIRFAKVDSDTAPEASRRFAIRSIPTLVLWHRGREVARSSGVMPASALLAWAREHLEGAG